MFGFVRLVIGLVILSGLFLIIAKSKIAKKRNAEVGAIVVTLVLCIVMCFIPIENAFITFASPEEAYGYYNNGTRAELIVEGQDSDLVIGVKNGKKEVLIVPKVSEGCKIGLGVDTKKVNNGIVDEMAYILYQHKKTCDYFIVIVDIEERVNQISDSNNSKFTLWERNYYAYISNIDDYKITINGIEYMLFED